MCWWRTIPDASGSEDPDGRSELEYKFALDIASPTLGDDTWVSEWGDDGDWITFSRMGTTMKDENGQDRKFRIIDGTISINYTLEPGIESRTFYPQVLVKEIPPPISQDEPLESYWTEAGNVTITVTRPPNHPPTATAQVMLEDDATSLTADTLEAGLNEAVIFLVSGINDPDNDPLEFTWTIQGHDYPGRAVDGQYFWAFETEGTYQILLTIDDGTDTSTDSVTVRVVKATETKTEDDWPIISDIADKLGLPEPVVLLILALPLLLAIAGGAVMHGRAGGEEGYDYSETAAGGMTVLSCPTCSSSIEVATPQRPIRVACGGCSSEFILRE